MAMSNQDLISYISLGIGVFGIGIAFYQGFEKKRLQRYFHLQSWHIFSLTNISLGSVQQSLKIYKEISQKDVNNTVLESLSKSDAYSISLFLESIRLIFLTEPKFDLGTISTWRMQGKISADQVPYFIKVMSMDTPSFFVILWMKLKQKLINSKSDPYQSQNNSQNNSENM